MIVKRKIDRVPKIDEVPRNKAKSKQTKKRDQKQKKSNKLHGSESLRVMRTVQQRSDNCHINEEHNENENRMNVGNCFHNRKIIQASQQKSTEHATRVKQMKKSVSLGNFRNTRPIRRSISPMAKEPRQKIDRHKYNSKNTNRSEKQANKQKQRLKALVQNKSQETSKRSSHINKSTKIHNKSHKAATRRQSEHLKTELSSKLPSVNLDHDRKVKKKKSKIIKMKDIVKASTCKAKVKESKLMGNLKKSIIFSEVSFNDYYHTQSCRKSSLLFENNSEQMQHFEKTTKAAVTIQRHFRGYFTRKCIEELKYMSYCAIRIQKVWRGYVCRRKMVKSGLAKRMLLIENSVVNIKDFNEEAREDRLKEKHFKFIFEDSSARSLGRGLRVIAEGDGQRQSTDGDGQRQPADGDGQRQPADGDGQRQPADGDGQRQPTDGDGQRQPTDGDGQRQPTDRVPASSEAPDNRKYADILTSLLHEQQLSEKFKQKIRCTLGFSSEDSEVKQIQKEKYVQKKLYSQISSEKCFNSPKSMCSPKAFLPFTSPSSKNSNKKIIEQIETGHSPHSEKVSKRLSSPGNPKSDNNSLTKQIASSSHTVECFETSFEFIEEFELIIVDILRDNNEMKQIFLKGVKNCEIFRTSLVLSEWNKFHEQNNNNQPYIVPSFAFSQEYVMPSIFEPSFRSRILAEPAMKIHLEDKKYSLTLWNQNQLQKTFYQSFLNLIFDSLSEAIYNNYRYEIITKQTKFYGVNYEGYELFKFILMNSLTTMQQWCDYLCGMEIPVAVDDINYHAYVQQNNQRLDHLVNNQSHFSINDLQSWILWIETMIAYIICQQLTEDLTIEIMDLSVLKN